MGFIKKNLYNLGSVSFEGLKMTHSGSKYVALKIYYFNVCEVKLLSYRLTRFYILYRNINKIYKTIYINLNFPSC